MTCSLVSRFTSRLAVALAAGAVLVLFAPPAALGQQDLPTTSETIQVTATRVPEDVETVPASVTVISGEELRARGATDLASALGLVAGVSIAPGGDNGPLGSLPELWGLKELDAFLLVVDGVPWGGAYNPALTTLDLNDVERIEVLRGAAPVMYGATSFVGVIHVIHRAAGAAGLDVRLSGGSYGSGSAAAAIPLSTSGTYKQSLAVNAERFGYKDDRAGADRGQFLYRGALATDNGSVRLDVSGNVVRQAPASPHPRQGPVLSPLVPLDANHNPRDAKIDEDRIQVVGGYERALSRGSWETTLSYTQSKVETIRGFLREVEETPDNAIGIRQEIEIADVYFDSHLAIRLSPELHLVAGLDYLYGKADAEGEAFEYAVGLDGSGAPSGAGLPAVADSETKDDRNFAGLYLQAQWTPAPRWNVEVGVRLNRTAEDREADFEAEDGFEPGEEGEEEEGGKDSRTTTRGSGVVGVTWMAWGRDTDGLWLFADYRNTFKPAAIDFGVEAEGEILEPETAESYEVGIKGRHGAGRFTWQASAFQMDFENLVLPAFVNGTPGLINAGTQRFKGVELEAGVRLRPDLRLDLGLSRHDAKFNRFTRLFDGEPFVLDGNRLELSPRDMAALGLTYAPATGFNATAAVNWVDSRFLNQRNTVEAPSYTTWGAGFGYRFNRWEIRLDGRNLGDTRPPISESEVGDAQYYRLPARSFALSWVARLGERG